MYYYFSYNYRVRFISPFDKIYISIKEVIQQQIPLPLPCYDLSKVKDPILITKTYTLLHP
jgi:hypothetical protein